MVNTSYLFEIDVYLLRIREKNQQGDGADPGGGDGQFISVVIHNRNFSGSVGHMIVGSISFLEAGHYDIRFFPVYSLATGGDVHECIVWVSLFLGDILAEKVGPGDHEKVVVIEWIAREIDVPFAVGFFVELEMEYFHS
jgi:hypothetical protein